MKTLNTILNTVMGAFVGVFLGHGLYVWWNYNRRPELYAMQSAPWYTSILVYGGFTLVVVAVCLALKALILDKDSKQLKSLFYFALLALLWSLYYLAMHITGGILSTVDIFVCGTVIAMCVIVISSYIYKVKCKSAGGGALDTPKEKGG